MNFVRYLGLNVAAFALLWAVGFLGCGSDPERPIEEVQKLGPCEELGWTSEACVECMNDASPACTSACSDSFAAATSCFEQFDCLDYERELIDEACVEEHCAVENGEFDECFTACPLLQECGVLAVD